MIIDCISDLHGNYPKLEGGDLLIVAGDLTAQDSLDEHLAFVKWCAQQSYNKIIYISGNHDNKCLKEPSKNKKVEYLLDSGTEFKGLKIWGSPWTQRFKGMNPHCMAFTVDTEEELAEKWALIPDDIDILVTHSPPHGILDSVEDKWTEEVRKCGSSLLRYAVEFKIKPRLHVFGHIHEGYGLKISQNTQFVNASHVNSDYWPVNHPIRIEL